MRLLKKHLKTFYYEEQTGSYEDGIYVDGDIVETSFQAVPMPLSGYEIKLFSQGSLNFDGIKIYSKYDLGNAINKNIKRDYDSATYRLLKSKPYKEIADIKIYVLERIEGES